MERRAKICRRKAPEERGGKMTDTNRTTIEVFRDYIETILIALRQKAEWHAAQGDTATGDDAIIWTILTVQGVFSR